MPDIESLYARYLQHPLICTDTRNISPGCIFFALKGANFDANEFALSAFEQGAAYTVIDNPRYATGDERCILVDDVLHTLQELARYHRSKLHIPVIGLTGSNGKTTSKELINAVLASHYKTFATKGNLNNHIGVPLSLLAVSPETEIAIIEMGANHQKEIEQLCSIAQPTHGLITNVGMAHLEGFGGFEGVKKRKAELYAYLKQHGGFAFINRNNPYLLEMSQTAGLNRLAYYGTERSNFVSAELLRVDPYISLKWTYHEQSYEVTTHLTGTYNFENILAAICIGCFFGLEASEINRGLAGYIPQNNRSQITETGKNTVVCDFYNANPSSMRVALANLHQLPAQHKTIIIGDMFELGKEGPDLHRQIIEVALSYNFEEYIFIGELFFEAQDKNRGLYFRRPEEVEAYLHQHPLENRLILLKGSRGMALEKLMPLL